MPVTQLVQLTASGEASIRKIATDAFVSSVAVTVRGKPVRVKVNADGYVSNGDHRSLSDRHVIRISSQAGVSGPGCTLTCDSCEAGSELGYNVSAQDLVRQVTLTKAELGKLGYTEPKENIIQTFGFGDVLMNLDVLTAFEALNTQFPGTKFTFSSSGPAAKKLREQVLEAAIRLFKDKRLLISFQVSVNTVLNSFRTEYMKGKPCASVEEHAALATHWFSETGEPVVCNFVAGPRFVEAMPNQGAFEAFAELYPASSRIKLSPEGGAGQQWTSTQFDEEISRLWSGFTSVGFSNLFIYSPPGGDDGSCAMA